MSREEDIGERGEGRKGERATENGTLSEAAAKPGRVLQQCK